MSAKAWSSLLLGVIFALRPAPVVASPPPPFIEIIEPPDGRVFSDGPPGWGILVSARTNATAGAPLSRVEFYAGNGLIGQQQQLTTPGVYQFIWRDPLPGAHTLRAVAVTASSQLFTSPPVSISITAAPVFVGIYSPASNALVRAGSNLTISAFASSARPITNVVFYEGTRWLGEDRSVFPRLTWSNVPPGEFVLRVVAVTDRSLMYTSPPAPFTAVTNLPPSVQLFEPLNGAIFSEGHIRVSARGTDADGQVRRIELFAAESKLGEIKAAIGDIVWSNVVAGVYTLTARAIDDVGDSATSAPVRITVLAPGQTIIVRGPYLQIGTPNSVIVKWRTATPADSRIRYGTDVNNLSLVSEDWSVVTDHEMRLSGLQPDTRYYYAVSSSTQSQPLASGPDYFFVTSPVAPKPTRVWVIGDSGTASQQARAVWQAYAAHTGSRYTDAWLMLGDNAYGSGADEEYQRAVFEMYPELLRQTPLWPTLGNHDYPDFYKNIFTLPRSGEAGGTASGTEHYYAFDYGNIHFICLDAAASDRTSAGPMCAWLREDLGANTKKWTIAFWHHPPYSKGTHDSDGEIELVEMRQNVVPVLESHGVDLVLCGHSHDYERSFLLRGHYGDSTTLLPSMRLDNSNGRPEEAGPYVKYTTGPVVGQGTVYVVAGCSGQVGYGSFDHPAMYKSLPVLGSLVLDIDWDTLHCKFLRETGKIDDWFAILKTDPQLRVTRLRHTNGIVQVSWQSLPGRQYQVERTTSLSPSHWGPVSSLVSSGGTRTIWTNTVAPDDSAGFYRVKQW